MLKGFEKKDEALRAQAATNLSFLYFLEGKQVEANEKADAAVRHDRYNAKALVNKGNCLFMNGEYERAKELFLEAIGVEADCVEAIYNLGASAQGHGCRPSPPGGWHTPTHSSPGAGLVNKRLALEFPDSANELLAEALQAFDKLHSLVPNSPEVIYQIAVLHETLGSFNAALDNFNILLTKVPTDPGVNLHVGQLFSKQEDEGEALRYHREVRTALHGPPCPHQPLTPPARPLPLVVLALPRQPGRHLVARRLVREERDVRAGHQVLRAGVADPATGSEVAVDGRLLLPADERLGAGAQDVRAGPQRAPAKPGVCVYPCHDVGRQRPPVTRFPAGPGLRYLVAINKELGLDHTKYQAQLARMDRAATAVKGGPGGGQGYGEGGGGPLPAAPARSHGGSGAAGAPVPTPVPVPIPGGRGPAAGPASPPPQTKPSAHSPAAHGHGTCPKVRCPRSLPWH